MIESRRHDPKVLSAFSGVGGLDLGLEAAGFSTIACIEIDPDARSTLRNNRPSWRLLEPGDILALAETLRPSDLGLRVGELDVLAGGPPCQPFSKAAQWSTRARFGMTDPRSRCISAFISLVKRFKPKVVLIENVEGFARGRSSALPQLESDLSSHSSYRLEWRVLDACDFGVAQHRRRAIMVALRDGKPFRWPDPTHVHRPVRAWDALAQIKVAEPRQCKGKWAGLLPSIPEGGNYLHHTDHGEGTPLFGYRTRYWSFLLKLAKDKPSWTISAQPGPATGPFHWENRPLNVEELLRLQSFPATWKVAGPYRSQVKQIGNATPPLLSEVIARAIGDQVFGIKCEREPALHIPRRLRVPPPEPTRPVSREFIRFRGIHLPHPGAGRGPRPILQMEVKG